MERTAPSGSRRPAVTDISARIKAIFRKLNNGDILTSEERNLINSAAEGQLPVDADTLEMAQTGVELLNDTEFSQGQSGNRGMDSVESVRAKKQPGEQAAPKAPNAVAPDDTDYDMSADITGEMRGPMPDIMGQLGYPAATMDQYDPSNPENVQAFMDMYSRANGMKGTAAESWMADDAENAALIATILSGQLGNSNLQAGDTIQGASNYLDQLRGPNYVDEGSLRKLGLDQAFNYESQSNVPGRDDAYQTQLILQALTAGMGSLAHDSQQARAMELGRLRDDYRHANSVAGGTLSLEDYLKKTGAFGVR